MEFLDETRVGSSSPFMAVIGPPESQREVPEGEKGGPGPP